MAVVTLEVSIMGDRKVSQSGGHAVSAGDRKAGEPEVYVRRGEHVLFMNSSGERVTVIIPIDEAVVFNKRFIHLDAGGDLTMTVAQNATRGVHSYAVYLHGTDAFAEENSTPKMMIEPPGGDEVPPPA